MNYVLINSLSLTSRWKMKSGEAEEKNRFDRCCSVRVFGVRVGAAGLRADVGSVRVHGGSAGAEVRSVSVAVSAVDAVGMRGEGCPAGAEAPRVPGAQVLLRRRLSDGRGSAGVRLLSVVRSRGRTAQQGRYCHFFFSFPFFCHILLRPSDIITTSMASVFRIHAMAKE